MVVTTSQHAPAITGAQSPEELWTSIDWAKASKQVRNLRQRIFRATQELRSPATPVETSDIVKFAACVGVVFSIGLPWVSPDVFFYIGTGWLDWHYGMASEPEYIVR